MKVELKKIVKTEVTLTMSLDAAHSINRMLWSTTHYNDEVHKELADLSNELDDVIGKPKYRIETWIQIIPAKEDE